MTQLVQKQSSSLTSNTPHWKLRLLQLVVLYKIHECSEKIPLNVDGTEYAFISDLLDHMHRDDLIKISEDSQYWILDDRGLSVLQKLVEIYDHSLKYNIFSEVNITTPPPDDICDENGNVLDHFYDPRFGPFDDHRESEDLRIAMMQFVSQQATGDPRLNNVEFDPHIVVFCQKLADEEFKTNSEDPAAFWFDLKSGKYFDEVEYIIKTAYEWKSVADDYDDAIDIMGQIYKFGMIEQIKRDGRECSRCKIPLGIFEYNLSLDGKKLEECPNPDCGASFNPPATNESNEYECPKCGTKLCETNSFCSKCHAEIDWSMREGVIATETVETTEFYEVWEEDYGYEPYGIYSPYDPFVDALVFCGAVGVVGAILW